jgi:hypothetical protein
MEIEPTRPIRRRSTLFISLKLLDLLTDLSFPLPSRRKKFYLILFAGQPAVGAKAQVVPQGLGVEGSDRVAYEKKRERTKTRSGKRKNVKDVDWILKKKELYRARGKADVPRDSKWVQMVKLRERVLTSFDTRRYTARSRKARF